MDVPKERLGILFVLVGPGGVGKNALLNKVLNHVEGLSQLPTATTRPMRPGEQQGREHQFVSLPEFQQMIDSGALLEYQEVYPGRFYGVPRTIVEEAIATQRDLIADIEIFGAEIIRSSYPENSISVFIVPPSIEVLVERLKARNASETDINNRLKRLPMEMLYAPLCDYIIVNDQVDLAAEELRAIIEAERSEKTPLPDVFPHHQVTFNIRVIPAFGDEVLCNENSDAAFPLVELMKGDKPEEAALNLIGRVLPVIPVSDDLDYHLPDGAIPVHYTHMPEERAYQLTYSFIYRLPERISPPPAWAWTTYDRIKQHGF